MKLRATKKEIKQDSYRVLAVGYCDLQYLLRGCEPFAYSCGVYGWCCDYYDLYNGRYRLTISTGYSPLSSQNIPKEKEAKKWDIFQRYESKARKIVNTCGSWEQTQKKLQKLVDAFINEMCEESEA